MTQAVSDVDRLVIILRQRLAERIKRSKAGNVDSSNFSDATHSDQIRQTLSLEGVNDQALKRALLQRFLVDQFGSEFVNEAKFQALLNRVERAMTKNSTTNALLDRLTAQLRKDAAAAKSPHSG